jgi:hypothetical protein
MGRTVTPKFVVVLDGKAHESMVWDSKRHGAPNAHNLEAFVMKFAKSLELGGANAHISVRLGHVPYPRAAEIRYNYNGGAAVASWKAATFQVYS